MANPNLASTLSLFSATVHRTKNRLIAIPAAEQRRLGLVRRPNNHIVRYSIRRQGQGRWNHLLADLTYDNEFAVPAAVTGINEGDTVEVKIHQVIPNPNAPLPGAPSSSSPGAFLSALAGEAGSDERNDGSQNVDQYLYGNHDG
jgi:hypothetical protein